MGRTESAFPSRKGDSGAAPESCAVAPCPVTATLQAIGGKWKVLILWHLQGSAKRFSELHRAVSGISHKILTQELKELAAEGLISREVFPVVPPRVEYSLTELGLTLAPVLEAMKVWGLQRQKRRLIAKPPVSGPRENAEVLPDPSRTPDAVPPPRAGVPAWV